MNIGKKPEIVFVVPDILGGVASFNRNIINNASLRKRAYVKLILVSTLDWPHPRFKEAFDADEVIAFRYDKYENQYAILRRLNAIFGPEPGAIFCNEGLEMESIYQYGTTKTVYQCIHDFYNLKLAIKYGAIADVFVTHSNLFKDVLMSSDPGQVRAFYLPHGVNIRENIAASEPGDQLKIVFTGRLVEGKGVQDLYCISQLLRSRGINVEWTIIGRGPMKAFLDEQWKEEANIRFAAPDTTEEVMQIMSANDIFLLPTRFEGSPVTILEALSVGIVPVVSDLPGGIREIVRENIGRTIPVGNNEGFADAIAELHFDRAKLQTMKQNARNLAVEKFDIRATSDHYFDLLLQFGSFKKQPGQLLSIPVGFRLDQKWLPNSLVSFIRKGLSFRVRRDNGHLS
jgi:glycosyltransferase involved in cell wall biosynthesis